MPFALLASGLGELRFCSDTSSCSRLPCAAPIAPAPAIHALAPQLTGGTFSQLSILEAEQKHWRNACGTVERGLAVLLRQAETNRRAAGAAGAGQPLAVSREVWAEREYTDRLMAPADAAQLDFACPAP